MAEPVEWLPDGTPHNARFGDVYRPASGGLEQARHVFLEGGGLPSAWQDQSQWRILETGFGLGLNFLAAWDAWRKDPHRPGLLHFVSIEAWPAGPDDLRRSCAPWPELHALAEALALQWWGLTPGTHRLAFEAGRVLLTLHVGDVKQVLRREPFTVDTVFLDGFDPECNPDMWDSDTLRGVSRHCRRGTRLATWTAVGHVRRALAGYGFVMEKAEGLPPKRHRLAGRFDPAWEPRRPAVPPPVTPSRCVVIGAGIAGSAAAAALALRGWEVTVLDAAQSPAAGASGLPVGLLAPHQSMDDNPLSRLTRAGVRLVLRTAAGLNTGQDWAPTGVVERNGSLPRSADAQSDAWDAWTRAASASQMQGAGLEEDAAATWHAAAGWVRPGALVSNWLATPGVTFRGGHKVSALRFESGEWRVEDSDGDLIASAPLLVVAAAQASSQLAPGLNLTPVRGQVSWGPRAGIASLPVLPVNGDGHFIPEAPGPEGPAWYCGSTFTRSDTGIEERPQDHAANLARLSLLVPGAAAKLEGTFSRAEVRAWTGIRCVSRDRRPIVGELRPGLWVSCAMGSRGLTFAGLCAEVLVARLHAEPLPLPRALARSLDVLRISATARPEAGADGPGGAACG